jgi:hypothetical protein
VLRLQVVGDRVLVRVTARRTRLVLIGIFRLCLIVIFRLDFRLRLAEESGQAGRTCLALWFVLLLGFGQRFVPEVRLGLSRTPAAAPRRRRALERLIVPALLLLLVVVGETRPLEGGFDAWAGLGSPPDGSQCLAFGAFNLRRIGAVAPFEV